MSPRELVERLRRDPPTTALFTDFDGTLSPIVDDPATARPVPGAVEALAALVGRYRRVAVLSGRPLAYLAPLLPVEIDIAALYGLEQRVASTLTEHPAGAHWRPIVAAAAAEADVALRAHPGVRVEPKGLSLTLHHRTAPAAAPTVEDVAAQLAARHGLHVQPAKASVELHPPVAVDKGTILREWVGTADTVVFFGDDVGDLPAFAALRQLEHERRIEAITVVAASAETPDTVRVAGDVVLAGPPAVASLLRRLAGHEPPNP